MTTHYEREILIDYIHGALEPETDAAVFVHLETCAACRALHAQEVSFGEALRGAARADEPELPSLVKARVWEAVRREHPTLAQRLFGGWGPRLALPVAAALALGIYLGVPAIRTGPASNPPRITAAYYLDEHNAQAQLNPLGPGVTPAVYAPPDTQSGSSSIDAADAATLDDAAGAAH